MMKPIEQELVGLVMWVREMIARGLKTEEIQAHLVDPAGTGHDLIERAVARRKAGEAFLAKPDAGAMLVQVEEPAPPVRHSRRTRRPKVLFTDKAGADPLASVSTKVK